MGQSVKQLVDHLRKRQEEFGVNAFRFEHVAVTGLTERQPASYPSEVQAVIDAGKSVKDWPKAVDIPIDLRLSRVDEDPPADIGNDMECSSNSLEDKTSIPQPTESNNSVLPSAKDESPDKLPGLSSQSRWSPTGLHELHRMATDFNSMHVTSSINQLHEKGNDFIQAGMTPPLIATRPDKPNVIDGPSEMHIDETNHVTIDRLPLQPSTDPVPHMKVDDPVGQMSVDKSGSDIHYALPHPRVAPPIYMNHNPDMTPQQSFNFAPHSMAPQYYIPVPQQIGGPNPISQQMSHPGLHPFMPQMVPDQWGYLQGHPYFPTARIGAATISGDPPKTSNDPSLLPPGMPTFSFPSSHEPQPFYGQSMTPSVNGFANSAPYPNISISQAESIALMPPTGTPSPKKKSPTKRGRASTKPKADTPTRRGKPKT
jgi:hypothetical protein